MLNQFRPVFQWVWGETNHLYKQLSPPKQGSKCPPKQMEWLFFTRQLRTAIKQQVKKGVLRGFLVYQPSPPDCTMVPHRLQRAGSQNHVNVKPVSSSALADEMVKASTHWKKVILTKVINAARQIISPPVVNDPLLSMSWKTALWSQQVSSCCYIYIQ